MSPAKRQGLSARAYAQRRGVSHTAVGKAIRTGRIALLPDGSIDPAAADRQWAANTDETKSSNSVSGSPRHRRDPAQPSAPAGADTPTSPAIADAGSGSGYTKNRTAREGYTALLTKLKYEREAGESVKVGDVRQAAFADAKRLQGVARALPEQLSGELVGKSREEIYDVLDRWSLQLCEEMQIPVGREP
jgi:hypothetical protein